MPSSCLGAWILLHTNLGATLGRECRALIYRVTDERLLEPHVSLVTTFLMLPRMRRSSLVVAFSVLPKNDSRSQWMWCRVSSLCRSLSMKSLCTSRRSRRGGMRRHRQGYWPAWLCTRPRLHRQKWQRKRQMRQRIGDAPFLQLLIQLFSELITTPLAAPDDFSMHHVDISLCPHTGRVCAPVPMRVCMRACVGVRHYCQSNFW